jgi:hypothetical protein
MTWAPDGRKFNTNPKLRRKLCNVFGADEKNITDQIIRKREIGIIREINSTRNDLG